MRCHHCGWVNPDGIQKCEKCNTPLSPEYNNQASRYTPEHISQLAPNEIFVFGSNLEGMHGGGAARYAYEHFGAQWGKGVGMAGQTYAIPTMQGGAETIKPYVDEFIRFARRYPQCKFLVTPIGCGIAGFTPLQIAPLFQEAVAMQNVTLPKEFYDVLLTQKFKQCAKGHYYTGSGNCPYCGSEEAYVPRCPYCGEPLRKSIPVVGWPIGSLEGNAFDHKVPWNYGWDGFCENCGHDFNIKIMQNHERLGIARETTIQVSEKSIATSFIDAYIGLSGVEIKQQTKEGLVTMFISTNELRYLMKALNNSPILDQWDWREDRT